MKKILMIDDELEFCLIMKEMIKQLGNYKVLVATSGKIGIKAAVLEKPHLVFLDITMPEMSGLEVLKTLRTKRRTRNIPVVMLTGNESSELIEYALSQYVEQYLIKPVEIENLKQVIDRTFMFKNANVQM
jgi:CheY-like chemotaxis protein